MANWLRFMVAFVVGAHGIGHIGLCCRGNPTILLNLYF